MTYLILNTDETFELRWVDYYTISGFDQIMNIEQPDSVMGESPSKKNSAMEQDKLVEKKIQEILEEKRKTERNINICMYGKHEFTADKEIKFTVTHVYHNSCEELFEGEDPKEPFYGEIEALIANTNSNFKMILKLPLKIDNKFKSLMFYMQQNRIPE